MKTDITKVKPNMDHVLLEKQIEEKSDGGILLPRASSPNSLPTERGKVIAVGPGKWEYGKFVETTLKVGQVVLYHNYPSGVELKEGGKEYTLIREVQVAGVVA
jgi:chaperonin GroES